MLALRSQILDNFARNILQACLGVPGTGCIKRKENNGFFLRKRLTINDIF